MKLAIGFGGILTLPRETARAQGYVGVNFRASPIDQGALAALTAFTYKYGPGSVALVTRCKNDDTLRELKEWLETHQWAMEQMGITEVVIVREAGERQKAIVATGATHALDDCAKMLGSVELTPDRRLLFGTNGMHDGDDTPEPFTYIESWMRFVHYFGLLVGQ